MDKKNNSRGYNVVKKQDNRRNQSVGRNTMKQDKGERSSSRIKEDGQLQKDNGLVYVNRQIYIPNNRKIQE